MGNLLKLAKKIKIMGSEGWVSFMLEILDEITANSGLERGWITKELTNEKEKL